MELKMKLNDRVLDSIKVHIPMCDNELYLTWLKHELRCKHQHLLQMGTEPFFYLEVPGNDK
jgi:hypothetical protein